MSCAHLDVDLEPIKEIACCVLPALSPVSIRGLALEQLASPQIILEIEAASRSLTLLVAWCPYSKNANEYSSARCYRFHLYYKAFWDSTCSHPGHWRSSHASFDEDYTRLLHLQASWRKVNTWQERCPLHREAQELLVCQRENILGAATFLPVRQLSNLASAVSPNNDITCFSGGCALPQKSLGCCFSGRGTIQMW